MTIYFVPGLANDKRIFKNLVEELKDYKLVFLEHLDILHYEETLAQYAARLINHHKFFDVDSVIIGMSLGGLIAIEMAKILFFKKVFLISTVKHKSELPLIIRLAYKLNIHLPPKLIKYTIKPLSLLLKATNLDGAEYLSKIINESNEEHMIWAQKAVVKWDNNLIPDNYVHIHGTHDEIFPIKCVRPTHKIIGGTHFMIMDRAEEISRIIRSHI